MRTVIAISKGRDFIYSRYWSEPILAAACAYVSYKLEQHYAHKPNLNTLLSDSMITNDLMSKGEPGEVICRTLFVDAYDEATVKAEHQAKIDVTPLTFCKGCSIKALFEELFHEEDIANIFASPSTNGWDKQSFIQTFSRARVRMLQVTRLGDDVVYPLVLYGAFLRGQMLIGHATQQSYDLIIPVLLDSNKAIHPDNMTLIAVSVKQRIRSIPGSQINAKQLKFFNSEDTAKPYIVIFMQLGLPTHDKTTQSLPVILSKNDKVKQGDGVPSDEAYSGFGNKSQTTYEHTIELEQHGPSAKRRKDDYAARWAIDVKGCSLKNLKIASYEDEGMLPDILSPQSNLINKEHKEDEPAYHYTQRYNMSSLSWLVSSMDNPEHYLTEYQNIQDNKNSPTELTAQTSL
ncbi:hypothetical protein C8Q74DRAFT_1187404 [Fomes fomentarius]|nr:hypothetical protein C8Q74DRAFT_1187402 [Fomes fomentarius]KAI0808058.1 hypothetical protein C8Q74DRAFT_1187404 [Fomes fomentarius]